ncbi:EAL domain-containing protein [Casimicrobium huifangae]|uniref:EAL domain-containing protein n=1 Tax=Casimicrobium huifangae TaxID=2591109 RepID=UPI0037842391
MNLYFTGFTMLMQLPAAHAGVAADADADTHPRERERLRTLYSYNLLDTAPEIIFDEVTALLAQICDTPYAVISLQDERRQWFKSCYGHLPFRELPREIGFCGTVVNSAAPLEVSDAMHDLRFHADPLVAREPGIRFYAGMPLLADTGVAVGALCVMDRRPRVLNTSQRKALSQLTDVVMRLFDARRHEEDATWLGEMIEDSLAEVLVFDAQTQRLLHANRGACQNLGYALAEIVGRTADCFIIGWNDERRRQVQGPLLRGEHEVTLVDVAVQRKDGSAYWAEGRVQLARQQGRPVFVVNARDITARKEAEEALYREKELAQITLDSIGDAVITTDANGHVTYLNPVAERLTGWSRDKATGRLSQEVFHIIAESDRMPVASPIDRVLRTGETTGLANNTALICRDGREFSVEDSAAPIRARDQSLVGAVLVFRDVTSARELSQTLSWQASHDALTDLVNRREFENLLGRLLASACARHMQHALLYFDLDQFKIVNDSCGHQAGDQLLRQLSAELRARMRKSDTLARLGGDEFGVLLDGCDTNSARQIATQLLDAIRAFRFVWQDRLFSVSASFGVAEISAHSESVEAVMSAADTACFMAKDKGRNQVQVFHLADAEVSFRQGEMGWASRLAKSVEENRFFLVFQRALQLSGEAEYLDYVEVLLRLRDEHNRIVPPMAFIPAAERYQLMAAVDRWVIKRVLHCIAHHDGGNSAEAALCRRSRFAVNLSGVSLSDEGFLDFVLAEFDASGANPSQLCFEITETAAISNVARVARFMEQMKARGCRFALDDFGSGLSSFAYLKNMPVDYLKIDGLFVKGAATDSTDLSMVESINRIGHVMGMKTIAEFVETQENLAQMRAIGVDFVQGYFVHHPEPFAAFVARAAAAGDGVESLLQCA